MVAFEFLVAFGSVTFMTYEQLYLYFSIMHIGELTGDSRSIDKEMEGNSIFLKLMN